MGHLTRWASGEKRHPDTDVASQGDNSHPQDIAHWSPWSASVSTTVISKVKRNGLALKYVVVR